MVLVDTSVWIEIFREDRPFDLEAAVPFDEIATCLPVLQEVLQGMRAEREYRIARDAMMALPIVDSPLGQEVFEDAVGLYRSARRTGLTVRSGVDCLIAACALRHNLIVFHHDRDFEALARVSGLRTKIFKR
ncbi:MAG TPA: PIN domain-containing protein [Candidatus Sulfotelmatobacter sp.]|nr:PIN domain-containing protein [Candidatus Sulfotelmatobacter sp.]